MREIVSKKRNNSYLIVFSILWLWIFSNCFTNVDSKILFKLDVIGSALHIHNILFVLFILYAILKKRWSIPQSYTYIFLFFLEISLVWVLNMPQFGISAGYISTVYGILLMFFVAAMKDQIDSGMINYIFESIAIVMAVLIFCNIAIHIDEVVLSLRLGWAHPKLEVFFGGGCNLEAVWMTMFGVFFRKNWKYKYWIFTSILASVYVSRTGILVNIVLLFIYLIQDGKKDFLKRILITVFILIIAILFIGKIGLIDYLLNRFINTGNEAGSVARLNIWGTLIRGVFDRPLGIGCGNTMHFLRMHYGLNQSESNAHNIYLQCLLENNLLGFLMLMYGLIRIGMREIRNTFSNPCGVFLCLYAFQGLFQTQLKEPFLFIVLAFYLLVPYTNYQNKL